MGAIECCPHPAWTLDRSILVWVCDVCQARVTVEQIALAGVPPLSPMRPDQLATISAQARRLNHSGGTLFTGAET